MWPSIPLRSKWLISAERMGHLTVCALGVSGTALDLLPMCRCSLREVRQRFPLRAHQPFKMPVWALCGFRMRRGDTIHGSNLSAYGSRSSCQASTRKGPRPFVRAPLQLASIYEAGDSNQKETDNSVRSEERRVGRESAGPTERWSERE